jgi:anthranilate synthase/aminodeoxychorismate synthase-like glutamine amidotransferase
MSPPRILVIDNRDSFTGNVVHALRESGAAAGVVDSRRITVGQISAMSLDGLVISPGPGQPADAGCSNELIEALAPHVPVWGICLGHQCLAAVRGARIIRGPKPVHGKTCVVEHDDTGLFCGLPDRIETMRYNSLLVDPASLPASLVVSAWTEDGLVMGLRCATTGAEGVQFHPESIMSGDARPMFDAFVLRCATRASVREGAA